jgi:serine/threonine-protein kinase ATR
VAARVCPDKACCCVIAILIAGSNRAQLLDRVLQSLPPRLGKWLLSRFSEPGAWLAARLAFTRTNAAWAMVGHVLGLGDRHGDNIMIHGLTGACCFCS